MDLARLRSRRSVIALAIAGALTRIAPVRAQWLNDCEYGMVNGLVSIGGANCDIAVPGHMIDDTPDAAADFDGVAGSTTQSPKEIRQARLQRRRDQRRTQRGRRTQQGQDKQDRKFARKILCSDFSTQKAAVEAMVQSPGEAWRLDPDEDGIPCQELTPLTCRTFSNQTEASAWFGRMGYTTKYDPFGLYDYETDSVCPKRGVCDDFSTQKAAVEWITDHPADRARLDPQNDGSACAKLTPVTCKSFANQVEATTWFNVNGFTVNRDPYHLYDAQTTSICPTKLTCADFKNQKLAVEWMGQNGDPQNKLDPDDDGKPCTNLEPVTCSQLHKEEGNAEGVTAWYYLYFTNANDPYHLRSDDGNGNIVVCPTSG